MIEMLNFFNLIKKFDNKINTFHLAEGPGGFIEAIAYLRKNKNDSYTGITLTTQDNSIPNWNKCKDIMKKYNNINLEYGIDNDGNILSPNNLRSCFLKYRNKMDLITADGGFDFSVDFNNQEKLATNLIFAEICFAILTQKKGGTLILKYFDIFHKMSIDMLYLLNCFYTTITITKPCTSRVANSEKYIVCENFKFEDTSGYFNTLYKIFNDYDLKSCNITSLIKTDIPCIFINQVTEINYILGQSQIENINSTIDLINNNNPDKLESIKKKNIAKCIEWCVKNNIPYHVA
jgi:23S rRNA U2552 (ribose-2'-O)-methylase RlmE/FtsJ